MHSSHDGFRGLSLSVHWHLTNLAEPDRPDVLLGAIVLEDMDFVVDCRGQKLVPRDPNMILSEIE